MITAQEKYKRDLAQYVSEREAWRKRYASKAPESPCTTPPSEGSSTSK